MSVWARYKCPRCSYEWIRDNRVDNDQKQPIVTFCSDECANVIVVREIPKDRRKIENKKPVRLLMAMEPSIET